MLEEFTWFKQSAYRYDGFGLTVYVDPWGLTSAEEADVIFITHAHSDHFDPNDIDKVRTHKTKIVAPADVAKQLSGENVRSVRPGESFEVNGIKVETVPAYNNKPHRLQAHPKENHWVGYILTMDNRRFYFSGDTDDLPELEQVKTDVAFLCIGGDPYVMNASEAARLARAMKPGLAVPNHYGYVVGTPADAEKFAKEANPVKVQIMKPVHAFEKTEAAAR